MRAIFWRAATDPLNKNNFSGRSYSGGEAARIFVFFFFFAIFIRRDQRECADNPRNRHPGRMCFPVTPTNLPVFLSLAARPESNRCRPQ